MSDAGPGWRWPRIVNALSEAAEAVESVDPDDQPLATESLTDAVTDATVIGLGESSHGTREFVQFRHRLVRHLVRATGLRVVGLETNFAATLAVNEYVLDGDGTAASALSQRPIHGNYQVEEMVEFVEWVRSFNEGRPRGDRVRIHGFDVQHSSAAAERLKSFLERAAPETRSRLGSELEGLADPGLPNVSDDAALRSMLEARQQVVSVLREAFAASKATYVERTSRAEVSRARRLVWQLEQGRKQFQAIADGRADHGANVRIRDSAMAAQVQWLLRTTGRDQIAIWGHNAHLTRGSFGGGTVRHTQNIPSLGSNLASLDDLRYLSLGLCLGGGTVTAVHVPSGEPREYDIEDPPQGSVPWVFARVDAPRFFLDFGTVAENSELGKWLSSRPDQFDIVGGYRDSPVNLVAANLSSQFDGVVFVRESSPTRPLSADGEP